MSRARRWLLRGGLAAGAVCLVVVALGFWLLGSESGARFTLARVQLALPEGSLSWQAQQGTLARGLRLQGLRYQADGITIEVERIELRARLIQALSSRLQVDYLDAEGLRISLPAAEVEVAPYAPFALELPADLPSLELPLAVDLRRAELRRIRVERALAATPRVASEPESAPTQATEVLFDADRLALVATLERGRLVLTEFGLEAPIARLQAQGSVDTLAEWRSALSLDGEWRAGLPQPQPFALTLDGDVQAMRLQMRLPDAPDIALDAELSGGLPRPRWRLDLRAPTPPPALQTLWPAGLTELVLQGEGELDRAEFSGGFAIDARHYTLDTATLRTDAVTLHVDALRLVQGEGSAELEGRLRLADEGSAEPAAFDVELAFQRFDLPLPEAPPLRVDGGLDARGAFDDAQFDLGLSLARGELAGELRGGLRLQGQQARLETLQLRTDEGLLSIDGQLDWSAGLAWELSATLADFDAVLLAPEFPSRLSARLRSSGAEGEGLRRGELSIEGLAGELRGQAVSGEIDVRWSGLPQTSEPVLPVASGEAELDLRWGQSVLAGRVSLGDALNADLNLQPLRLEGLAGDLAGEVRGRLRLSGTPQAPRLAVDLSSAEVALPGLALAELTLRGELGLAQDAPLQMQAEVAQARADGRELGALSLDLRGSTTAHALAVRQSIQDGGLALELSGGWRAPEQRWLGRLQQFEWRGPGRRAAGGDWALTEPVALELGAKRIRVDMLCLEGTQRWGRGPGAASTGENEASAQARPAESEGNDNARRGGRRLGAVCLSVDGAGTEDLQARAQLDSVPLALPMGFVFEDVGLRRPRWQGELGGELEWVSNPDGWRVTGRIGSPHGVLRMGESEGRELLSWDDLIVGIEGDDTRLQIDLGAAFGNGGRLDGALVATELSGDAAQLQGRVSLQLEQLGLLELLSEEAVIAPVGRLSIEVDVEGPLAEPQLRGGAALSGFSAEVPALGITPREGRIDLSLDGSTAADITLSFRSEGELRGRGRLDWTSESEVPLRFEIEGSDVLLSDTAQVQLVASPNLQLEQRGDLLRLRGRVDVPRAQVRLDRFEGSQQVSADVVVLDPAQPERAAAVAQRVDADVRLALGADVELEGFGLEGKVRGELRVRDRPGRATSASGSLDVGGRYKAYGQDLDITRGRLSFAQSPLDNPGLDIRAERRIDEVTVGIRVTGTAAAPVLSLWSQPSLDQADVLSYLMLGRPVRSVRGGEGQQLNAAAAALGAGGNYIAERLGARLGFDQASVEDSATLGGAALMLGKYLSPRLYVAYGVALFGEGQVFSIKYLLTERWDLQVEASQRETRGSVNYRLER